MVVGLRGEHAELVTPEPGDGVLGAHGPPQGAGDVAQQVVAGGVTEAVVELLEAVEVQHHQSEGLPRPPVAGDLVVGAREQRPAVGHAGHGIRERIAAQRVALAFQERQALAEGDCAGQ